MSNSITIGIATHNRGELFERTLDSILEADWSIALGHFEILIVTNACSDKTEERLLAWKTRNCTNEVVHAWENGLVTLRIIDEPRIGLGWARRRIVSEARGEVIALLDDDIKISRQWPFGLNEGFKDQTVAILAGKVLPWWERGSAPPWFNRNHAWVVSLFDLGDHFKILPKPCGIGANLAFRRVVPETIGNFNGELGRSGDKLSGGEESDFLNRAGNAGFKCAYSPEMSIEHWVSDARLTPKYFSKIARNYGAERIKIRQPYGFFYNARSFIGHIYIFMRYGAAMGMYKFRNTDGKYWDSLIRYNQGYGGIIFFLKKIFM